MLKINFTFVAYLVILTELMFLLPTNPYLELLSHFSGILFLVSMACCLLYARLKNKTFLCVCLLGAALTAYPVIRSLDGEGIPRKEAAGADISILQCNISYRNKTPGSLLGCIRNLEYPDIVVIQEVTPELIHETLIHLKEWYPYTFEASETGAYGMAVLSKIPIVKAQRKAFAQSPNKYTIIEFMVPEEGPHFCTSQRKIPLTLIEVHALSPPRDRDMNQRKQELEELPAIVAQAPHRHKILVGDLNTTPYSPYFSKLMTCLGFKNAMGGITSWNHTWVPSPPSGNSQQNGKAFFRKVRQAWCNWDPLGRLQLRGTWPSSLPFFLRIPIDHLLTSKTMRVLKRSVCEHVGSDHLPVVTHLRLWADGSFDNGDFGI